MLTRWITLAVVLCLAFDVRAAEDEPADTGRQAVWQPYFLKQAGEYRIAPTGGTDRPFLLHDKPILRWSQPVRGGDDGAVWLWLDGGRPAVIGTTFAWPHKEGYRVVAHEFHSFASEPLTARWRGKEVWAPNQAGVQFKPIPDAPPPAGSAAQRLLQMRQLARQFTAGSIDHNDGKWELRLLAQPLHRYKIDTPGDVLDGALFALVQGTDPEALLLIEARRDGNGTAWHYALARFSDYELHASHNNVPVWNVPRGNPSRTDPHYYFTAEKRQPPTADDEAPSGGSE